MSSRRALFVAYAKRVTSNGPSRWGCEGGGGMERWVEVSGGNANGDCVALLAPGGPSSASPVPQINKALAVPMSPSFANCLSRYQRCREGSCGVFSNSVPG
ncbi:hypothetical protein EYF80_024329 [Liparis tanakae]|uniref:Uncharacterized protein n=1 Tax=Liparis tanakae TaxID=230148 RepID=A0A4Z2HIY4_9TELE|nr:hypothetical protein EYF80_024329 [Liparis tanakae]